MTNLQGLFNNSFLFQKDLAVIGGTVSRLLLSIQSQASTPDQLREIIDLNIYKNSKGLSPFGLSILLGIKSIIAWVSDWTKRRVMEQINNAFSNPTISPPPSEPSLGDFSPPRDSGSSGRKKIQPENKKFESWELDLDSKFKELEDFWSSKLESVQRAFASKIMELENKNRDQESESNKLKEKVLQVHKSEQSGRKLIEQLKGELRGSLEERKELELNIKSAYEKVKYLEEEKPSLLKLFELEKEVEDLKEALKLERSEKNCYIKKIKLLEDSNLELVKKYELQKLENEKIQKMIEETNFQLIQLRNRAITCPQNSFQELNSIANPMPNNNSTPTDDNSFSNSFPKTETIGQQDRNLRYSEDTPTVDPSTLNSNGGCSLDDTFTEGYWLHSRLNQAHQNQ